MRPATLACVAALVSWAAMADTPADVRAASRLEDALAGLASFRAEFRQTVTDADGQQTEAAEGTVALARPGKFRWDYRIPPQLIVSDGVTVWLYDEDLAQVTVRPAAEALIGTPALLLSGRADVRSEFQVTDGGSEDGLAWSRLVPKDSESDFQELRVGIAGGVLRRMVLVDRLGQTTRLDFERIERNPRLDSRGFSFTPPPGVDVVGRAAAAPD
jgi:outer membrane lipoprotein carrier protein